MVDGGKDFNFGKLAHLGVCIKVMPLVSYSVRAQGRVEAGRFKVPRTFLHFLFTFCPGEPSTDGWLCLKKVRLAGEWGLNVPDSSQPGTPLLHKAAESVGCGAMLRNNTLCFSFHLALSPSRQNVTVMGHRIKQQGGSKLIL